MTVFDLLEHIKHFTQMTQKDLADYLNINENDIRNWKKSKAIPSQYQVQTILNFARIMGVDISDFRWESYIESVFDVIYGNEYRICGPVEDNRFMVRMCRVRDGVEGVVSIEDITNKKKDLMRNAIMLQEA